MSPKVLYRRVCSWARGSANRQIFLAALTVGGGTAVVKGMAMAKELVVAYHFGTADALDAFLIAFMVPSFAVNVTAGAVEASFMPTYIEVLEREGKAEARRLLGSVIVGVAAVLAAACVLLGVVGPFLIPLVGSSFGPEKLALTEAFYYLLIPIVLLKGVAIVWARVLNAGDRYALAAVAPALLPAALIVFLVTAGDSWGGYVLVVGTLVGYVGEVGLLAAGLVRGDLWVWPAWGGWTDALGQTWDQFLPMIVGNLLVSSAPLIDKSMAAILGSGKVAALNYGVKVPTALLGLGSQALSTAVLPYFSRMTAAGDWAGVRHTLHTYVWVSLGVTIPVTAGLVYVSDPLVALLFERGAFTQDDTQLVGLVQALYLLQVPAYVLSILAVRLISSLKSNRILMVGSALNLAVNVGLNYLFIQWLGLAGIALSTAVVYVVSFLFLYGMVRRVLLQKQARLREDDDPNEPIRS
ncbi:murein biosynthesis integral membrane protein MurJ [Salinibacter ruber]|uniref:murein biosynthesis integral membrane protein MurJ n=1 Tax=Salinibacter ruber TaxID=146919 RepID=UPI002073A0BC|nr:lipid II flippase MurJ [Salinibacter ruber]